MQIDLEPVGEATRVRLTHSGLVSDESRANHKHGWEHYVRRLGVAAAGGDPGADPWATPEGADAEFDEDGAH